jgi:hypothetical protein
MRFSFEKLIFLMAVNTFFGKVHDFNSIIFFPEKNMTGRNMRNVLDSSVHMLEPFCSFYTGCLTFFSFLNFGHKSNPSKNCSQSCHLITALQIVCD